MVEHVITERRAYPAAGIVSPALHTHFARHRDEARLRGQTVTAALPDPEVMAAIIDAAFWASLRREEGYVPFYDEYPDEVAAGERPC